MSAIICQWSAKRKVSLSVSYSLAFFIDYSVISKFQSFQPRFVFLQRSVQVWINSTQKGRKILFGVNKIFKQRKLRGQVETEHLRSFVGILTEKNLKNPNQSFFWKCLNKLSWNRNKLWVLKGMRHLPDCIFVNSWWSIKSELKYRVITNVGQWWWLSW